jgi:hypothetical protein
MIKLWGISLAWHGEDENLRTWELFEDGSLIERKITTANRMG